MKIRMLFVLLLLLNTYGNAGDIKSFVPAGWRILNSATGDLNKDAISDNVLILEKKDSIKATACLSDDPFYYHDRALLVLFGVNGNGYKSALRNDTFIPLAEEACMEEPFGSVEIKNGILTFGFGVWMSAGGWSTTQFGYTFRFQNGDIYLIGQDINTFARNTMEYTNISINYSTRKMRREEGNEAEDRQPKVVWSKISSAPLVKLRDMSDWQYTPPGVSY